MSMSIRAIQADIAAETGEPCPAVVAERYLDMALMLHHEVIASVGWCEGGYCCDGTDLHVRDAEYRALAAEAKQYREEAEYAKQQDEAHKMGPGWCMCYECQCGAHAMGMIDMDHPFRPM